MSLSCIHIPGSHWDVTASTGEPKFSWFFMAPVADCYFIRASRLYHSRHLTWLHNIWSWTIYKGLVGEIVTHKNYVSVASHAPASTFIWKSDKKKPFLLFEILCLTRHKAMRLCSVRFIGEQFPISSSVKYTHPIHSPRRSSLTHFIKFHIAP